MAIYTDYFTPSQKQDFPASHRSLEISQTTRDSHISTAPTEAGGWKSGKPKAGFPLSHRHESSFSRNLNPGRGRASPSARRRALRAALRVKEWLSLTGRNS